MTKLPSETILRDQYVGKLECSHFELGRLLREKIAPAPIRVDSVIQWYVDEAREANGRCQEALSYWRRRRDAQTRTPEVTA